MTRNACRHITMLFCCGAFFFGTALRTFGFYQWEDYRVEPAPMIGNHAALDSASPVRLKPLWGLDIGGIWLSRKTPDSQALVFDQTGNVLSNADQLQGSMGSGLDTTLSFFNVLREKPVDFQMRFFQASGMTADQNVTATRVIPLFYSSVPADPMTATDLFYKSKVRSFEANAVYRTPFRIRLIGGFRYFEVDEIYDVIDPAGSTATSVLGGFSRTDNAMAGGQIGAEGVLVSNDNGRIFGSCKWAVLANDATGSARAANPATGGTVLATANDSITTQLLDFQLGGSLGLMHCVSLYAGYQGLVASDVALVLEQNRNASLFAGTNPIFRSEGQWHGFRVDGSFVW